MAVHNSRRTVSNYTPQTSRSLPKLVTFSVMPVNTDARSNARNFTAIFEIQSTKFLPVYVRTEVLRGLYTLPAWEEKLAVVGGNS